MIEVPPDVVCSFDRCTPSMVERVVMATVDQLCAHADVAVDLLDALEFPLGEVLGALADLGVERVGVRVFDGQIQVSVELRATPVDLSVLLGETAAVVASFFDIAPLVGDAGLSLTGRLV